MARTGRPRIELDWKKIEALAKIKCTEEEISAVMDCDLHTLQRDCKRRFKMTFAQFLKQKGADGNTSLRRQLFLRAKDSDACLIFLAKNWLKMSDKIEQTVTADVNANVTVEKKPNLRVLSDEELKNYRALVAKMEET